MTPPRLDEGSEREAFEAWLPEFWTRQTFTDDEGEKIYCQDWVQGAWVGWCAALSTGRLGGEALVINATQLRSALEFVAPDFDTDEDQREQEVVIQRLPARTSTDGEPMEAGLYCWLADYPEEGCIPLREDEAFPAPAAQSQGEKS